MNRLEALYALTLVAYLLTFAIGLGPVDPSASAPDGTPSQLFADASPLPH